LLTPFEERVAQVVQSIPKGSVLGYSQVALRAGRPGAARGVARAMGSIWRTGVKIPWWRVVRANRTLAPQVAAEQARRLSREGVRVRGRRIVPSKR
jgi:methylated-DNA-protein-cysteine methyltransferase-like protein